MNKIAATFYILLIICAFALSTFVSRQVGNITVLAIYGIFLIVAVAANTDLHSLTLSEIKIPFRAHPALLIPAVILWVIFVIGFAFDPSFHTFLRLGAFTVLSAITLFVVPAVVSRKRAFCAISILGALCAIIGLPTVFLGDYSILGLNLGQAAGRYWITPTTGYWVPAAIFDSVKYFRVLVAIGAVCSGALYSQTRDIRLGVVFALNLLAVILTVGRASILAVLVAGLLAVTYRIGNSRTVAGVTILGGCAVVLAIGITFGILPGPTTLGESILGKRVGYWTASYQAFAAQPILGQGLVDTTSVVSDFYPLGTLTGTHNSYLRLFVIGGIIGGIAYLMLCASALILAFRAVCERIPLGLTTFCLVVVVLILQLFDGTTIFGTALSSVLWALVIGYAQPGITTTTTEETIFQ